MGITVTDVVEDIRELVDGLAGEYESRIGELVSELDEAAWAPIQAEITFDWVDAIVREAEGRMMDGVSPGEILAAVIMELRERPSLTYCSMAPMATPTAPYAG